MDAEGGGVADGDQHDVVVGLLERLRTDEALLRLASEAARNEGVANRMLPETEIMRHITAILDAVAAVASGDPTQIAQSTARADDLAVDRLQQGISLQDVLRGFGVGRSVLVDRLIQIGRDLLGAEALLPLLTPLDTLVGGVQERMILAYRAGERDLLRSRRTAQIEALRELLSGGEPAWATEAGLEPDLRYHCMVADVSIPKDARRLEQAWAPRQGVSGIVQGYLCRITAELPSTEDASDLVVISPRVAVDELADTFVLCRQAIAAFRVKQMTGPQKLLEVAQNVATGAQPLLGRLLARELLANLDPANEFHRELAVTAHVYIASGNRTGETASHLHVHTNTLRYRLKRFAELTASAPAMAEQSLAFNLHLSWALEAWLSTGATVPGRDES